MSQDQEIAKHETTRIERLYSQQGCFLVIWSSLQRSLNMARKLWRIRSTSSWPAGRPLRQLWHARPRRGGSKIKTWTGKKIRRFDIVSKLTAASHSFMFMVYLSEFDSSYIVICIVYHCLCLRWSEFPGNIHLKSSECAYASAGPPNAETPRCNAASAERALKVACTSLSKAFHAHVRNLVDTYRYNVSKNIYILKYLKIS